MREITNLSWPGTPYGAEQRPFGRPAQILTAVSLEWVDDGERAVPVCASAVYLRVHRTRTLPVDVDTIGFGFHAVVIERDEEAAQLAALVDRVLVQARRHAAVLAGHSFTDDLAGLHALADTVGVGVPGVTALTAEWEDRREQQRGIACLFDTCCDVRPIPCQSLADACATYHVEVESLPIGPLTVASVHALYESLVAEGDHRSGEVLLAASLERTLTVALVAAAALGKYAWADPLPVASLLARETWDRFTTFDYAASLSGCR
ncbi:hypothetical protein LI90_3344 [Carbonactinospora thermoautotrophica]|uniref:Uncharacterized protein n=1 Tax=Carbonactinospora thermoautotrophica TaxID=1469144 RepID=A0A132MWR4_9ACTN|nr:hypothetical protein [Carbonactinospora thermoautotrophica]KWX02301.1 hypothetical protein LI90_3344 [Carbonactinospora thermoautotrophica]